MVEACWTSSLGSSFVPYDATMWCHIVFCWVSVSLALIAIIANVFKGLLGQTIVLSQHYDRIVAFFFFFGEDCVAWRETAHADDHDNIVNDLLWW